MTKNTNEKDPQLDGSTHGRNQDLSTIGCLALVQLWYLTSSLSTKSFAMVCGQTSTHMYIWLKFDWKVLLHVLVNDQDTKIAHLTDDEVRFYQNAIGSKYPNVSEVRLGYITNNICFTTVGLMGGTLIQFCIFT